jgi:hypothetical protein
MKSLTGHSQARYMQGVFKSHQNNISLKENVIFEDANCDLKL